MAKEPRNQENEELQEIQTHTAAATDLHKTRHTSKKTIEEPESPNPGPYDVRTENYAKYKEQE